MTNICKPYYCVNRYIFDYYKKMQKICLYRKFLQNIIYAIFILIIVLLLLECERCLIVNVEEQQKMMGLI